MEIEDQRRHRGALKPSKKGGKPNKALTAEEEARRREEVKERVREQLELEKRARQVVERLLVDSVSEDFLLDCAWLITPANYKDVVEERSIARLCGYALCPNELGKIPAQKYKICTKTNKVYDITERKCFCSNVCYKASKVFELQISKMPLWLRTHESPPKIDLMKRDDGGSLGEEVRLAETQLSQADVETPAGPVDGAERPQDHDAAWSGQSDSSSSSGGDSEQEQEFVSSIVSRKPRRTVHWDDLPEGASEAAGGQKMKRRSRKTTELEEAEVEDGKEEKEEGTPACEMHVNAKTFAGPVTSDLLPSPTADDFVPELESRSSAQPTHTQDTRQSQHTPPVSGMVETVGTSYVGPPVCQDVQDRTRPSTADGCITQVGVSKRGAAGLRRLLENCPTASTNSAHRNPLDHLRRTLSEWRTEETLTFLHCSDGAATAPASSSREEKPSGDKVEEELDEDDLEDEEEDKHPGSARMPSASTPDYQSLQTQLQQMDLRVKEFDRRTFIPPEETNASAEAPANGHDKKVPIVPLVDSHAQHIIQKRITVDKLSNCLRSIVGPLRLTMNDISTDLNSLVKTFRFTSTNIVHKSPEWTLIAVVLLHLLSDVSPLIREALRMPTSVEYLNTQIQTLGLQQEELQSLVQLVKSPTH